MEKKRDSFDKEYILYGEKSPRGLGFLAQSFLAVFRYLFNKNSLTIADARRLRNIHEKTGMNFPLKGEDFREKK